MAGGFMWELVWIFHYKNSFKFLQTVETLRTLALEAALTLY